MPAANRLLAMEEGDLRECVRIVRSRKTAVNIAKRAQMLVLAAQGLSNRQIALELGANEHVVGRVRKEYRQRGLAVLEDRARPGRPRSSRDEQSVQKVVKTVCQAPAKGLSRWSADAGWASGHSFGHRQPHSAGEQFTASSVADLYL